MFAVGSTGVKYLTDAGFPGEQVHNLPSALAGSARGRPGKWRKDLGVSPTEVLLVTGSRLTQEKGFDVLIRALCELEPAARNRLRRAVVGSGPQERDLRQLADDLGLSSEEFRLDDWLPVEDFGALVRDADVVVHAARSDSYG